MSEGEVATEVLEGLAGSFEAEVLQGPGVLQKLAEPLDELAAQCAAPVTARRPWLECWLDSYPEYEPVAVCIRDSEGLLAAAFLAVDHRGWRTHIVGMGHGASDQSRLLAINESAAKKLAAAIVEWLDTVRSPWTLTLAQLPQGDATTRSLNSALSYAAVQAAIGSPSVQFDEDRSPGTYMSSNYRGQANNKWNRLRKKGHEPAIDATTSPEAMEEQLPRVMDIALVRQEQLTGRRKLENGKHANFFQAVVKEHARRGELELLMLKAEGEIVAYTLSFLDNGTVRMWSGHYDPEWAVFSPGHILARTLIERCLEDPSVTELDWMLGMEPYKLRSATKVAKMETLRAWSGPVGWGSALVVERLRDLAIAVRDRFPVLRRVQIAVRKVMAGTGGRQADGSDR